MKNLTNVTAEDFVDEETEDFIENVSREEKVFRIVKNKPDGVNAGEIAESLDITKNTALKILRTLEAEREIYSAKIGNTLVWYPNGRLIHPYLEIFTELRGKPYRLSIQESKMGPLVQIQERSYSLLEGERVEGAIFIEYSVIDDFIVSLKEIKKRFENFDKVRLKT